MQNKVQSDSIVYIVDDDADVRNGLAALFDSVGVNVKLFNSATAFLGERHPEQVSCLVLDVRLPGMSGLDIQATLIREKVGIPIIFISGYGDIPMTVKAMKLGAVEFLTKPVREQDLLDAVRNAHARDQERLNHEQSIKDLRSAYSGLSPREQQIMAYVTSGLMNKQTASETGISEITVKVHRHNLMKKLGAKSLAELVRMADRLGLERKALDSRP